jgi:hypothetical protein
VQYDIDIIDYIAIFFAGSVSRFLELFEVYSKLPSLGDIRDKFRLFMRNGVYIKNKQSIGLGGTSYAMEEEDSRGRKGKELSRPARDTSRSGKGSIQTGERASSANRPTPFSKRELTTTRNRSASGSNRVEKSVTLRIDTTGAKRIFYNPLSAIASASTNTHTSPIAAQVAETAKNMKYLAENGVLKDLSDKSHLDEFTRLQNNTRLEYIKQNLNGEWLDIDGASTKKELSKKGTSSYPLIQDQLKRIDPAKLGEKKHNSEMHRFSFGSNNQDMSLPPVKRRIPEISNSAINAAQHL